MHPSTLTVKGHPVHWRATGEPFQHTRTASNGANLSKETETAIATLSKRCLFYPTGQNSHGTNLSELNIPHMIIPSPEFWLLLLPTTARCLCQDPIHCCPQCRLHDGEQSYAGKALSSSGIDFTDSRGNRSFRPDIHRCSDY
jgi:hypothetical protein